ncbi:MAG: bis(5'-nucleosyl)-tetraphosphatase (symmetrical) YqeK [Oscillospiraceae bacterium]|jgi:nicotinate-nucleotide adenylyltransferase|nr:bis(5'-nucleosyl)-tetraphosphatase (symmetrical) YqeK [Oscillospiraceae bacterium]
MELKSREQCRALLRPLLPPERLWHCECVADAAVRLARRYGANEHKAMLAGMLHDCAKYFPPEENRRRCAGYDRTLRAAAEQSPQVCHAFAGAAWLEAECGLADEEILGAVRWHTTGRAGMTTLEKVIFVADLISADRSFADVEEIRRNSRVSLEAAVAYILQMTIGALRRTGESIHPASLACLEELTRRSYEDARSFPL